ncbi:MAG: hypothetical protein GXO64_01650 [Candidatus Micrarchaeota archaeon]|nr:hypothetical protein [Candidatus Micrarchaeota archaeon]
MEGEMRVRILIDNRESSSGIIRLFENMGISINVTRLDIADYICSASVGIERKTVHDFISSIKDGRLFDQLSRMKEIFEKPILLIEGDTKFLRNGKHINASAVNGAFSSIASDYNIPIIWTSDRKETAEQIYWIAKREQENKKSLPVARATQKMRTTKDMQEFLISGLPEINTELSKRLLSKFRTPYNVFNADIKDLTEVEGVGIERAKRIYEVLHIDYD